MTDTEPAPPPNVLAWGLGIAASAGLTGMLCCVAPMVLFMFGLMGGAYAISFADFFYAADGSAGLGAWVLRVLAAGLGIAGIFRYRAQQQACSLDPSRERLNLALLTGMVLVLGVGAFYTLEAVSSWYFDAYIVPAQQQELGLG